MRANNPKTSRPIDVDSLELRQVQHAATRGGGGKTSIDRPTDGITMNPTALDHHHHSQKKEEEEGKKPNGYSNRVCVLTAYKSSISLKVTSLAMDSAC